MPSAALDQSDHLVYAENQAFLVNENRPAYSCPECKERMVFVDGTKYVKHFRHYRRSDCEYETEPETEEHFYAKRVVEAIFRHLALKGTSISFGREYKIADPEINIAKYADVYCESKQAERKIAVEVQQANYDISRFLDKILFYYYRDYAVVYLFIGDQFGKTITDRETIYTLKEIENRIFQEKSLPIWGAYLSYDSNNFPYVDIPSYRPKYKKGSASYYVGTELESSNAYCSTRYIKEFNPQRLRLKDWLYGILYEYDAKSINWKLCNCKRTAWVKSQGKIVRYKEVCAYCRKTLRWVPNSEARSMGLEL